MIRILFSLTILLMLLACSGHENDAGTGSTRGKNDSASSAAAVGDLAGLAALDAWLGSHPIDKSNPSWRLRLLAPIWEIKLDPSRRYFWKLETNQGDMTFELLSDFAPIHTMNFAFLSRIGYFDGLCFHRVIPNFMAQGGCPKGDGTGGPGYEFDGEFRKGNPGHAAAGMLSTANSGPGTDGSQFFITFDQSTNLDGKHTVFGRLTEGEATLQKLKKFGSSDGTPRVPLRILKALIVETERG